MEIAEGKLECVVFLSGKKNYAPTSSPVHETKVHSQDLKYIDSL